MPAATCLYCTGPVAAGQPSCPALAVAGVAAHHTCCGGCAAAGFVRPELTAGNPPAIREGVVT